MLEVKLKRKSPVLPPIKHENIPVKKDIITPKTLAVVLILIVSSSMYMRCHTVTGNSIFKDKEPTGLNMKSKLTWMASSNSNSKILAGIVMALLLSFVYMKHSQELSGQKITV